MNIKYIGLSEDLKLLKFPRDQVVHQQYFYSNTAGYFKSILEVDLLKNARNIIIFQSFAFLIIPVGR